MRIAFISLIFASISLQLLIAWRFGFLLPGDFLPQKDFGANKQVNTEDIYFYDWRTTLLACIDDTNWLERPLSSRKKTLQTSVNKTTVVSQNLILAVGWSTITIQTYTADGSQKTIGGDSWRAIISGDATQYGIVFDRMNGRYDISFLLTEAGNFTLQLLLEYSTCDGLRNPPQGWFEKGDIHGHFQEQDVLGVEGPQIPQLKNLLNFEIKQYAASNRLKGNEQLVIGQLICDRSIAKASGITTCEKIWNSFGSWKRMRGKYVWRSCDYENNGKLPSKSKLYEKLWIFGDSTAHRWWNSRSRENLCKKLFKSCTHTFTFTYKYEDYDYKQVNIGNGFNISKFFQPIRVMFDDAEMKNNSVIVINFGIHLIISLNFSACQNVVDRFLGYIHDLRRSRNALPLIIWKTTTFAPIEQGMFKSESHARFLTHHRIRLFNSYANSRFCSAGIPIFDVFPLTASYPGGSIDGLHFEDQIFKPAEEALESFLIRNADSTSSLS